MKTQIFLFFLLFMFAAFSMNAQQQLVYAYDAAGNRISRTIVMSPRSLAVSPDQPADSVVFQEQLADWQIKIYPNPVRNDLNICISGNELSPEGECILYSVSGQLIFQKRIEGETTLVDMSRLSPGTYILHIILNGDRSVWTIVKP